jgi:isopentenyldiphosphate isomerase
MNKIIRQVSAGMEILDIYDESGNRTGKSVKRGQELKNGEFHLVVHIYIINKKGEFLIQKRSLKKKIYPGLWDVTGGAVISGEDSETAALREVKEEVGIQLLRDDLVYITRLKRRNTLVDVWAAYKDAAVEDVVMQEDEVDAVKYVSGDDLIDIVFRTEFRDDEYKNIVLEFIRK